MYMDTLYIQSTILLVITSDRGPLRLSYKFNYASLPKTQEEAAEKLTTSEENPNLPKNITNREESTEISIEQEDVRIYSQL